jgi:hypothetical protein
VARNTLDEQHIEFTNILEELLASDQAITAREIARRHSTLSSASTITRHPKRRELLESYQKRQGELRHWKSRLGKTSKDEIATKLESQQARIIELETTVKTITTGHIALIAAVAQIGGMGKLAKFYENFREIRNSLQDAGAIPREHALLASHSIPSKKQKG